MKIILLGPPGAGKGTQAEFLCKHFNIPRISTGDLLREQIAAKTDIGLNVSKMIAEGNLVPEEIVIALLNKRIQNSDCKNGLLLDGFPRTVEQAKILEDLGIAIDYVIDISVPDEDIISRLSGRRFHPGSGRSYHVTFNPPKVQDKDDETGEPLICREDDKEETIRNRLAVYHQHTKPIIDWYKNRDKFYYFPNNSEMKNADEQPRYQFIVIDGRGSIQDVQARILEGIGDLRGREHAN